MKVAYLGAFVKRNRMNMEFIEHKTAFGTVVEINSEDVLFSSEQDSLDIMANIRYLFDSSRIVIHKENLSEAFFDLKEFIRESNKGNQVNFLTTISEVL